jgi:ATP-dependent DNA helicase RecG
LLKRKTSKFIERQNLEWKISWRDEYLKWICGFANAQGGVLEIGRNDKGEIVGLSNPIRLMEELPNKMRDMLGIVADVNLMKEKDRNYIRIEVEPYPFPVSYKGEYHYRSGSTKQVLKGQSLDRFLLSKTGQRWDAVPIPGVKIEELNKKAINKFRERAAKSKRLLQESLHEMDSVLIEKLRLVQDGFLKRAAILLFYPDPERFIQGAYVKIGYFKTNSDLLFQDDVHGDLFSQVDRTLDLLMTKYFKATINFDGIQRLESYPVPEAAIRETLLNAIAHKDYGSGAPIQISVYPDRILFWNNGFLPDEWTVEKLKTKHPSQPYNPDIAHTFFLAGMIEAWGRGINKIFQACLESGLVPPDLHYDPPGLWVKFTYNAQTGTKLGLSQDQVVVLRKCLENKGISDLMNAVGRKNRTKFRDQVLSPLMTEGLVEMTLPGKPRSPKQKYRLTDRGHIILENLQQNK